MIHELQKCYNMMYLHYSTRKFETCVTHRRNYNKIDLAKARTR